MASSRPAIVCVTQRSPWTRLVLWTAREVEGGGYGRASGLASHVEAGLRLGGWDGFGVINGRSHSEQKTSALAPQADVWAERGLVSATWPEPDIHGVGARALRPTSS